MKTNKLFSLLVLVNLFSLNTNAQLFDNYGIKTGTGISNTYWDYSQLTFLSGWKGYKPTVHGFVYGEKNMGRLFCLQSSIGYTQKGFIDEIILTDEQNSYLGSGDTYITFHNAAANISAKIKPSQWTINPYIIIGFSENYRFSDKSILTFADNKVIKNSKTFEDFNKFNAYINWGLGIDLYNSVFIEIAYAHHLSKYYKTDLLEISERYVSFSVGVNLTDFL